MTARKEDKRTNLGGISEIYRTRAGLGKVTKKNSQEGVVLDDSPADGELPVTGGETQPPGTERQPGTDAAELTAPEPTDVVEADVDGQGDQSGRVPEDTES